MDFSQFQKYISSGSEEEFRSELIVAIQNNDLELMKILLVCNSFSGALSTERVNDINFAASIISLSIEKQSPAFISTLLAHAPFCQLKTFALQHAVTRCNLAMIREILKQGVDVKATNASGETFLHMAINNHCTVEVLQIFLNHGLHVDAQTKNGHTPLWLAVKNSMVDVVRFLIRGANVNVRCQQGNSLIHVVLEDEVFSAHSHERTESGFRRETNADIIKLLFSKGILFDLQCCNGKTPLTFIILNDLLHLLPFIQKHVRAMNFRVYAKKSLLHHYLDIFPTLTSQDGSTNWVRKAKNSVIKILLDDCPDVNVCNYQGDTLLHIVVTDYANDCTVSNVECEEMIDLLVSKGADIHLKNSALMTPAYLAIKFMHIGLLRIFKKHGADFNGRTRCGDTMMHMIIKNSDNSYGAEKKNRVVEFLIANGCDFDTCDGSGMSPLLYALKTTNMSNIAKTLIRNGADVNNKYSSLSCDRFAPLHFAVSSGDDKIVDMLLKYGAEVNCCKSVMPEATPLYLAAQLGHKSIIEKLIKAGSTTHVIMRNGQTPLHAATKTCESAIPILLEAGVPVNAKDNQGHTMLHGILECDNTTGFEAMVKFNFNFNDVNMNQDIISISNFQTKLVWTHLIKYLLKRKALNFPISSKYNFYVNYHVRNELELFYGECQDEVRFLKSTMVNKKVTYYDLLHMKVKKRAAYIKDESLINTMDSLSEIFPEYSPFLFASHIEVSSYKKRMQLEELGFKAWFELIKIYIDDVCAELIVSYMDDCTLERLVQEYKAMYEFE